MAAESSNSNEQVKVLKQIRSNTTLIGLMLMIILLMQLASCAAGVIESVERGTRQATAEF